MQLKLVSTENGFFDFNVSGAGTIRRVTVSDDIKYGDAFNIYYGDGHTISHRKGSGRWLGRQGAQLASDVEKSIRKSQIFIGEAVDSEAFYRALSKRFCHCMCSDPYIEDPLEREILGVDLDYPEYGRASSRYVVYLYTCGRCLKALTGGRSFGSYCSHGLGSLKALAQKEARTAIGWGSIITSLSRV